jgi:hypothetical protein
LATAWRSAKTCQNAVIARPEKSNHDATHMKARDIVNWRIAGLLVAIFIIVGLPYVVTLNNLSETQQTTAWVAHSNAVKAVTYEIAYLVRDSEAAAYRMLAGDGTNVTQMRVDRAT